MKPYKVMLTSELDFVDTRSPQLYFKAKGLFVSDSANLTFVASARLG